MRGTDIGIGRALRRARLRQGLSIEDASRGTRLRPEYLEALEKEAFDVLPGDVYVRGFLRSYSRFLGLNPHKVVTAFELGQGRPGLTPGLTPTEGDRPPPVPSEDGGPPVPVPGARGHFPWPMAAGVAVIVLAGAAAAGFFSRSASTPLPAERLSPAPEIPVDPEKVNVDLVALRQVQAVIREDETSPPAFEGTLVEGEARSFQAERSIDIWLQWGDSVRLAVNGHGLGRPGSPTGPFKSTYTPSHFRSADG